MTGCIADVIAMLIYFVFPSFRSQPYVLGVMNCQTAALKVISKYALLPTDLTTLAFRNFRASLPLKDLLKSVSTKLQRKSSLAPSSCFFTLAWITRSLSMVSIPVISWSTRDLCRLVALTVEEHVMAEKSEERRFSCG